MARDTDKPISLVPLSRAKWFDDSIGASVEIMIPVGTTLVKHDLSADLVFIKQKQAALALCAEQESLEIDDSYQSNLAVALSGNIQRSIRALEETRKAYKKPIDAISREIQATFVGTQTNGGVIALLHKAKQELEGKQTAWENKLIADRKEREAARARPTEEDELNPEYEPPKTINAPSRPLDIKTESGTRYHRKVVTARVVDESKLPAEFWKRIVDLSKLQETAKELAEKITEPAIIRSIRGVEILVEWKGTTKS